MSLIDDQEGATAENPKFSTDEEIGASYAFFYLFQYCKILNHESKELVLPAEKLASNCYQNMFSYCTSLTKAPVLKAKKLEQACYNSMFMNCSKLGSLTCLATDISANGCVDAMLSLAGSQVEGDKILYVDPSMTTGADWKLGAGWTVTSATN